MSAHTPGPWRVIETHLLPHDGDHVADMSNGLMVVANAKLGAPLADARLIAAAPKLLEALKYARRMVKASECDVAFIDDAIAKATGAKP